MSVVSPLVTLSTAPAGGAIAPLANIAVAERAYARVMGRGPMDPGIVVMNGPSGWGKSVAAAWLKARYRAYYVQADDFWTKKTMLIAMCRALGIVPAGKDGRPGQVRGSIFELAEMVKEQLEKSRRLLIIDEFDYLADKNMVEAIRSLYEGSRASILVIGEEALPQKLEAWERFHGRVLDWFPAQPVSLGDARELAGMKCAGVAVADDLLMHIVELAKGSVRRVNNNLDKVRDEAVDHGWVHVDLALWGNRQLQTGAAPRRV